LIIIGVNKSNKKWNECDGKFFGQIHIQMW
jgi:hypothetical protein